MPKSLSTFGIYSVAALICIGSSLAWLSWRDQSRQSPEGAIAQEPAATQSDTLDLAQMIAELEPIRLEAVAADFRSANLRDPDSTRNAFTRIGRDLIQLDEHEQALDLAAYLFGNEWIPDVEREVMHDWIVTDTEGIRSYFGRQSQDGRLDEHQLSILASLLLNEYHGELDNWSEWIASMPDEGMNELHGRVIAKMMIHARPENHETVARLVETASGDAYAMSHLPRLLENTLPDHPDRAINWITSLEIENPQLHSEAIASVIARTAGDSPEKATQLLETGSFGEASDPELHDLVIASYVRRMVHLDRDLADQGLVYLRDESLKQTLAAALSLDPGNAQEPRKGGAP
ncbi:MAG: hypothetical protein AAGB14_11280 [Verrucomicrobiota bacterium]